MYGHVGGGSKLLFWEDMATFTEEWDIPRVLGGDFNTTRFSVPPYCLVQKREELRMLRIIDLLV